MTLWLVWGVFLWKKPALSDMIVCMQIRLPILKCQATKGSTF